jgi:NADPH-dependent F420 reductase
MKKTIAVIGAGGAIGSALSPRLAAIGHRILLMDKDSGKCQKTFEDCAENPNADIEIVSCIHEGSWEADIIVPAVAYEAQKEVADYIRDVVTGKIVISLTNPFNDEKDALVTSPNSSAAEELQRYLPYSKVVKAFNTIFASEFRNLKDTDCFIAGDDTSAVTAVASLARELGMIPHVAGKLQASRTLEGMMLLLKHLCKCNNTPDAGTFKILFPKKCEF